MKNRDVYRLATALLAESGDSIENGDYEERAGYLLAAFCSEVREIDQRLRFLKKREASAEEAPESTPEAEFEEKESDFPIYLSMDGTFPCVPALAGAGGYYLAAMLILDEDADLSDKLFSCYCDAVTRICAEMKAIPEKISDRYGV